MVDRVESFIAEMGNELVSEFETEIRDLGITSPIEMLMATALLYMLRSESYFGGMRTNFFFMADLPGGFEDLSPNRFSRDSGFHIHTQFPIGKYKADFFVDFAGWNGQNAMGVIECDGHDFHERTKKQAEHDKARDRYFQSLGLIVLRYTGAEIHRDPLAAAHAALLIFINRTRQKASA